MFLKKTQLLILFLIILAFQMSSCTPKIDSDLLGNKNCVAPCWMGIEPSVTDSNTAIEILESANAKENGNLTILPNSIEWKNKKNYLLSINNNLIYTINMEIDGATIGDIVKLFDEPGYFLVYQMTDSGYSILLLYPDKGLAFEAIGNPSINPYAKVKLEPNMNIVHAIYNKPGELADMLKAVYGKNYDDGILQYVNTWIGYGNVLP